MAATDSINDLVPTWAVHSLGDLVRLTTRHDEYGDGAFVYAAGTRFRLAAIQPEGLALVECLEVPGGLLDVPFAILEPAEFS